MDKNNPIIQALFSEDQEFRKLFLEHEELEKKLADLDDIHYLTPEQEIERRKLQKVKLRGKDLMEAKMHKMQNETSP